MNLMLNQYRKADLIQSGFSYKGTYLTSEERVKFYYMQAPTASSIFKTTLRVTGLTSNFYPTILITKNVLKSYPSQPA